MNTQVTKTDAETVMLAQFDELRESLPGADQNWVTDLRSGAIETFHRNGLPHRRLEDWKYTDLRTLIGEALPFSRSGDTAVGDKRAEVFASLERYVAVFVDGYFRPDLSSVESLPDGVELLSLEAVIGSGPDWLTEKLAKGPADAENSVLALNTAFMSDGAVLRVGQGVAVDRPIELAFLHSGVARNSVALRNLVILEDGASATLLESHTNLSDTGHVSNVASELSIGEGASLDHVKVQAENIASTHLATLSAVIGGNARFNTFTATMGSAITRNEISVRLNGENTTANISGGYMISGKQHCDTTLLVDHAVPNCDSKELFKGVIEDEAHGVFQGRIIVQPDAQKTDARMMTKGLLLSQNAQFTAKPELEIFADDVQCGHGATSGDLDEEMLFYLRSRGVPEQEAKALLIAAFVAETFEQIEDESIREVLQDLPTRWLADQKGNADA